LILVQRAALATELVRDLPRLSGEVIRAGWNMIDEDPEASLGLFRRQFDQPTVHLLEQRWDKLKDFERSLEIWRERGIHSICFDDSVYPQRWIETFGKRSPRFLFAFGNIALLSRDSMGVVGSRDASDEAREFARTVANEAVGIGMTVVSGAARGIDQVSMGAAIEAGGTCVGITPELSKSLHGNVEPDQICLISPFSPDASFSAGNAMSRNKLIYAHGLLTIVVQSDVGAGGTWSGAIEAISKGIGRVAVWTKGGLGCEEILRRGGVPIADEKQLIIAMNQDQANTLFD
jgi:predicted Rossmann fold nucleotide-binding protein DprA/Smf involved in DNA uptake